MNRKPKNTTSVNQIFFTYVITSNTVQTIKKVFISELPMFYLQNYK